jgi:hypothetical protein
MTAEMSLVNVVSFRPRATTQQWLGSCLKTFEILLTLKCSVTFVPDILVNMIYLIFMNIFVEKQTREFSSCHFKEVMKSNYVSKSGFPLHLWLLVFHINYCKLKVIYNSGFICVTYVS